jgi:DNA-binding phage protein
MVSSLPVDPFLENWARDNHEYRRLLVAEAAKLLLDGEAAVARGLMRDVVRGAFGYDRVAEVAGMPRERLVRLMRSSQPVTEAALLAVLRALKAIEKIELEVVVAAPRPAEETAEEAAE